MSYFGVSTRNGVGLSLGTVPSLTNTPLGYRLAPSLDLSFAGSDTLDPRVTFSRTTNATVTGSNGTLQYAPHNLLTFSEQFDNAAWFKSQVGAALAPVVTANTSAAPDGTLTADTVVFVSPASGDQSILNRIPATSAGTYTGSFYIKATSAGDVGKIIAFRHVSAGTFTLITLTSSWQRATATEVRGTDNFEINLRPAIGTSSGTVSVQLWGAQLELGSAATTYNPTTVKNLLGFTENFDNAAWAKSNSFVQTNLLLNSTTLTTQNVTVAAVAYTLSFFGTGTITLTGTSTAGPLVGTGVNDRVTLTFTPTAGTLTLTVSGTVSQAQLVQGATAGDYKATYAAAAAVGYTDIYGQPFAQKLVATAVSGNHRAITGAQATVTGTRYTASVYAKQGEYTKVGIGEFNNFVGWATFDLSTGTVLFSGGVGSAVASITDVGNGWFRCAVSFLAGPFSRFDVYALNNAYSTGDPASYSYTGDGTSGIYIFGAQLSDSASVDPYVYQPVAAPTSTAYYGPRFDYDPVTLAPKGLLIEEQRTNLLTYSEQFDNAAWTKQAAVVVSNAAISPNGTLTADLLYPNATLSPSVYQLVTAGNSISVRAKAAGKSFLWLIDKSGAAGAAWFNLTTGTKGTVASGYTSTIAPLGNGWYQCTVEAATGVFVIVQIGVSDADNSVTPTVSGTSGIYIWGAQLEAGAFATSYIPTVASQVTRAADSASMIGNNFARWYTQGLGTLFADWGPCRGPASTIGSSVVTLTSGIGANDIEIDAFFDAVRSLVITNSAIQGILVDAGVSGFNGAKAALGYQTNDFALSVNGRTPATDTSAIVPFVNEMRIGAFAFNPGVLNGTIKRIAYYPRRLANTELQGITS